MIRVELQSNPLLRALEQTVTELEDMTDLMSEIGEQMLASTKDNFLDSTAPDGTPWAPRSQATLDAYARRGEPGIGTLRHSLTLMDEINWEAGPNYVDWGPSTKYGAVHQFGAAQGSLGTAANGSPAPWGDIPARPYIGIGPEDEDALATIVEDWLEGLFRT